jgi:light-harvesting protein B-800-850 alpha chain
MKWLAKWLNSGKRDEAQDQGTPAPIATEPAAPPATAETTAPASAAAIPDAATAAGTPAAVVVQAEAPSAVPAAEISAAVPAAVEPAAEAAASVAISAPARHPQDPESISAEAAEQLSTVALSPELAIRLIKDQCTQAEASERALGALREKYDALLATHEAAVGRLVQVARDGEETPLSSRPETAPAAGTVVDPNRSAIENHAARLKATLRKERKH